MSESEDKARKIISLLEQGVTLAEIKKSLIPDEQEWYRVSKKIYAMHLSKEKKERKEMEQAGKQGFTKNDDIEEIIALNTLIADYALALPNTATMADFRQLNKIINTHPINEKALINKIETIIMAIRPRALMQKGRFESYAIFKNISTLIESATLCYYRENYQSAFLTLIPVIEGALLRWLNYDGNTNKPEFDNLRKFFRNGHLRSPCPGNPLFYDVLSKVADKIINQHLYKPSHKGNAWSNFNRHLAVHLLNDNNFATRDNCIRLFLLLDIMSELYLYETCCPDKRFYLEEKDIHQTIMLYHKIMVSGQSEATPEKILLSQ